MENKTEFKDENLQEASDTLTENTERIPNEEVQKEVYENCLGLDKNESEELSGIEQSNMCDEIFEDMSDDELESKYDEILNKPTDERTEDERALLGQNKERYLKIKFYRQFEDAKVWFSDEYPDRDFEKIVNSNDFLDFAAGIRLPIRELLRRFVTMTERFDAKNKQTSIGPGSVKTYGATVGKDYFSPAEVDKMSDEEVEKNLETIKKSMKKWK